MRFSRAMRPNSYVLNIYIYINSYGGESCGAKFPPLEIELEAKENDRYAGRRIN